MKTAYIGKFNKTIIGAVTVLAGIATVANATTTTSFGSIPGIPATGQNPFSGSGIPYNEAQNVVVTDTGASSSDTLTMSLAATAHGSVNPAPVIDSPGVYTVGTGLVSSRSKWNFDFYVNSANDTLGDYIFTLTEMANGDTYSFNPTAIPDNVGGPASAGNSESLDFTPFGPGIDYKASQNDTYDFTLTATLVSGAAVASESIVVNAGTGAAPDSASTIALLGAGFAGLAGLRRRLNRA